MDTDGITKDTTRNELDSLRQIVADQKAYIQQLETELRQKDEQLSTESSLFSALLNNVPDYIYYKDHNSCFLRNSLSHIKLFGSENQADVLGKSDLDFFPDHASDALRDEQHIIHTGIPMLNMVESETWPNGRVTYVTTSKFPLMDAQGCAIGTFGISKDITELKELEIELRYKNDELTSVEEELRQNLEELQTIQDDLLIQKGELEKTVRELDRERYLMDSLMRYIPDYIYFKDLDCRFLRNSLSHIRLFGSDRQEDILGMSDLDFFPEHAQAAFKDEQNIIKTGKPILNAIEQEVWPDGHVTYVSTSKMPLYDKLQNIIGTFGISKDITPIKLLENSLRKQNEELSAKELELQTINQELHQQQEEIIAQRDAIELINKQLEYKNDTILFQNEQIKSSIRYAQTIQSFILPTKQSLNKYFEHFIIYKPKDIVSGDYYWLNTIMEDDSEKVILAVVDCTGHGVPGAIMSMISSNLLNHIVLEDHVYSPKEILKQLDLMIRKALRQDETNNQDGVDISLVKIEKKAIGATLVFSGAKNSIYHFSKAQNKLKTLKADKKSIGGIKTRSLAEFTNTDLELEDDDLVYLTTDGFTDQNNASRNRFTSSRLIQILEANANADLKIQRSTLEAELEHWMEGTEQRDDITVLAIRI